MFTAAAAVASAAASVHHAPMAVHGVEIAGQRFTYPTLNLAAALLLVLATVGVAVMTIALRASWRQRRAYASFMRQMGILGPLEGDPSVTVIEDPRPQAFCAGYLRPAVYVSQRTLELLSDTELDAVLAHEHHHRHARDPLRFALARVFSQALFFLPVLRALRDRYGELAELTADDAAVRASAGDRGPLASALLLFEASGPPQVAGISPQRVDSLLGQPVQWRLPSWLIATSLLGLSSVIVLLWRTSEIAAAHATLNLPILSSQPCLMLMTLLPLAVCMRLLMRRVPSAA